MIEVYPNLFVGDQKDFEAVKYSSGWHFVLAAKEPFHREALGYHTRGAPKDEHYFYVERGNRLILNLVDAASIDYVPKVIIVKALDYIHEYMDGKVGIFCNQGKSRAPSLALMYLLTYTNVTEEDFLAVYPNYSPAKGIKTYIERNF